MRELDRARVPATALRYAAAAAGGVLLHVAYPPRTVWWTAVVAFALLWWALDGVRLRRGAALGALFGFTFSLAHLFWIQDFLGRDYGPFPWLGLSLVMAGFPALGGALAAAAARLPAAPLWGALAFTAQEWLQSRFPFNGFPWSRVAFGQVEGPFLPLAAVGGAPLVSVAVVATGFCAAAYLARPRALVRLVPVAVVVAVLLALPHPPVDAQDGTRTVAVVQGNAPDIGLGLFGAGATVRRNHLAETAVLAERVATGAVPRPDLVVWPESSVTTGGTDPSVDRVVDELGVPFLVGGNHESAATGTENAITVWSPGTGPGERYAKQELVPFGERIPLRSVTRYLTPFVALADFTPGTGPAYLDVAGTRVATAICYETAYDHVLRDGVADGGELIVVPTNNAWYGRSEMTWQHLAQSRLRAVEHGRAVVVAALSGVSAVIRPDGSVAASTGLYTADTLVGQVPLRTGETLATRWGAPVEHGLALAGLLAAAAGWARHRRAVSGPASGA
ncbi:apolipoprotein N-acyltransferase [Pseudonocardia spirodelae]|uniref:Apolipoprotein N-acyltransferase n=1 Tax=Pseudonocardia spirodelae TaxID=3133431 RepID=A0ABU8T4T6_9PSEU